jgi:hypothetical protein
MKEETLQRVKELREKGVKRKEIAKQLGISTSAVDRAFAKIKKAAATGSQYPTITEEQIRDIIREELEGGRRLPLVLKDGKGEELSPEGVYYDLVRADGADGERDFRALMKWGAAIELVRRMTEIRKGEAEALAATIKPTLDMMGKSREELDAAVARAKESSMAIAEAAAAGAAARATMHIDERFNELKQQKPDIATVQDPMRGLWARTMESMMTRMQNMMFGGQGGQVGPTPGLVDKRVQK